MTPEQVRQPLTLGASVAVSARRFTPGQLMEFAGLAVQYGGSLILRDAAALTPDQRAALAGLAGHSITFDFTE